MSIAGKHYYRLCYLRSEEWKTVRLEALARDDAECQICAIRSEQNDAHHIYYPESIWDTKADHLVTLCRHCHSLTHVILGTPKTLIEGMQNFELLKVELNRWARAVGGRLKDQRRIAAQRAGAPCWFCQSPTGYIQDAAIRKLELPDQMLEHAVCDNCILILENSPYVIDGHPWRAIRKLLSTSNKNASLTKTAGMMLSASNGTGRQHGASGGPIETPPILIRQWQ